MTRTYVCVDVETTGLDAYDDAIIEVAAVVFTVEGVVDEFASLVDPGRELPPEIIHLTGITPDMVADAPSLFNLRARIRRLLADHPIVGHNVSFDMGFLEAARLGIGQHRLDTITLASILRPDVGRYSLDALVHALDLPNPRGAKDHRALGDVRRTVDLFIALYNYALELPLTTLSEIVEAGQRLSWPETIFFQDALREAGRSAFGKRIEAPRKLFKPPKLGKEALNPKEEPDLIDVDVIAGMLRPGGNFSRAFPDFEYRAQQVQMVAAVAHALNQHEHLIVEAGTGTGKSVGYLLPAAFWSHTNERPVVISTNTINLQDQLIHKDLPELQKLLPFNLRATILKGRRNYLCTRLFQQLRHSGPAIAAEMTVFARVLVWLPNSQHGDVSEISLRSGDEQLVWSRLSAENDGCRRETCSEERCPLHIARRRAQQAHIVVVNHSLLLADVASGNVILPDYLDLIIDEAHHLEAAVTDSLSFRADKRSLSNLLDEVTKPRAGLIGSVSSQVATAAPSDVSQRFETYVHSLRGAGTIAVERVGEFFMAVDWFMKDHVRARSQFAQQVRILASVRKQPGWDEVELGWENLANSLEVVVDGVTKLAKGVGDVVGEYQIEDVQDLLLALTSLGQDLAEVRTNLNGLIFEPDEKMIYWIESFRKRLSLHAAPLHIGPLVEEHIFKTKEAVILTSATLRTAGRGNYGNVNFDYVRERLYAHKSNDLAVGSPFDYKDSTLVYLVTDMPEPKQPGYDRYVAEAIVDVAKVLGGRTMVLFTSYGQLKSTGRAIAQSLSEANITILSQSAGGSRQQLLAAFKAPKARAVLLGTRSFWEGVDVPGEALQAVLITKLPFDVPSDPIFAARSDTFDSPFFEYSIPEAILRFRQGFGRLIRRRDDQGIVVILDKRVLSKRYGQSFLDSLPESTILRQRHARLGELARRWLDRKR